MREKPPLIWDSCPPDRLFLWTQKYGLPLSEMVICPTSLEIIERHRTDFRLSHLLAACYITFGEPIPNRVYDAVTSFPLRFFPYINEALRSWNRTLLHDRYYPSWDDAKMILPLQAVLSSALRGEVVLNKITITQATELSDHATLAVPLLPSGFDKFAAEFLLY